MSRIPKLYDSPYVRTLVAGLLMLSSFLPQTSALAQGTSSPIQNKKTVCSITINSDDEIKLFRQYFPSSHWNFAELTPTGKSNESGNADWFYKACKKKTQCDVLVVSGHFGGAFFGSSDFRLSMEDLERHSCDAQCDGIINQPKEVFLFGCNTLASKEKDHRSPEEYMRVLMADGFSQAQAAQVVAFRYSAFGDTFKTRMSQVFGFTPRIYGFSSVSPTGENVAPLLKTYLASTQDDYLRFDDFNQNLGSAKNKRLMTALKSTSITQTPGLFLNSSVQEQKPYCYLSSEKISRLKKLEYVRTLLTSGRTFSMLPHIQKFVHEIKRDGISLSKDEESILSFLAKDANLAKDLHRLLELKGDVYLPVRIRTLGLMKELKIISVAEFASRAQAALDLDFSKPILTSKKDLICSLDIQTELDGVEIPKSRWGDINFVSLLGCLRPQNIQIHRQLAEVLIKDNRRQVRTAAAYALQAIKLQDPKIHQQLVEVLIKDSDDLMRWPVAYALQAIKPQDPKIHQQLVEAMIKGDGSVREAAASVLKAIKPQDPRIHQQIVEAMIKLVEAMSNGKDYRTSSDAVAVLLAIRPEGVELIQYLEANLDRVADKELARRVIDDYKFRLRQSGMDVERDWAN